MLNKTLRVLVTAVLVAGCSSAPRSTRLEVGLLTTEQEEALQACRQQALASDGGEADRGQSAATGAAVGGAILRQAAFEPLVFLLSLPIAAAASAASAVADAKLTQGRREAVIKQRTAACLIKARRPAQPESAAAPTRPARNGAAELRALGVETPR